MNYKQDLLNMFYSETDSYTWLFKKDRVCAAEYSKVLNYITALDLETLDEEILMDVTEDTINLIVNLSLISSYIISPVFNKWKNKLDAP